MNAVSCPVASPRRRSSPPPPAFSPIQRSHSSFDDTKRRQQRNKLLRVSDMKVVHSIYTDSLVSGVVLNVQLITPTNTPPDPKHRRMEIMIIDERTFHFTTIPINPREMDQLAGRIRGSLSPAQHQQDVLTLFKYWSPGWWKRCLLEVVCVSLQETGELDGRLDKKRLTRVVKNLVVKHNGGGVGEEMRNVDGVEDREGEKKGTEIGEEALLAS
jgi:hypothetical protein